LEELEPHFVHPSRCKAIASARLKDDEVNARTLAHLLRAELLPEARIAPQAVRDQRALLRHRAALVRVAALKCRVHAILADRGVGVAEPLWGSAGRVLLAELALSAVQRAVVTDCRTLIDAISLLVAPLERDLVTRTRPDPRVQALQALPWIGPITAMTLMAEIGDITRFSTARKPRQACPMPRMRAAETQQPNRMRPHEPPRVSPPALMQRPATRGFMRVAVAGIPRWHARGQGFKSPQLHSSQQRRLQPCTAVQRRRLVRRGRLRPGSRLAYGISGRPSVPSW
jgi:Transposase IS116/IS110/IS902 family